MNRPWIAVALLTAAIAGCGETQTRDYGPDQDKVAKPSHIDEIYDQQKGTCKTEARFNTPEYRNHNGSTNPEEYARYAAEHGFFKITSEEEMQAAVDGCLDGIQQLGDKAK